jgi:hypothetical protein
MLLWHLCLKPKAWVWILPVCGADASFLVMHVAAGIIPRLGRYL